MNMTDLLDEVPASTPAQTMEEKEAQGYVFTPLISTMPRKGNLLWTLAAVANFCNNIGKTGSITAYELSNYQPLTSLSRLKLVIPAVVRARGEIWSGYEDGLLEEYTDTYYNNPSLLHDFADCGVSLAQLARRGLLGRRPREGDVGGVKMARKDLNIPDRWVFEYTLREASYTDFIWYYLYRHLGELGTQSKMPTSKELVKTFLREWLDGERTTFSLQTLRDSGAFREATTIGNKGKMLAGCSTEISKLGTLGFLLRHRHKQSCWSVTEEGMLYVADRY